MALLTPETVPAYVTAQLGGGSTYSTAEEIHGGNLNYAFKVSDESGHALFVKQSPDFIKVFGPEAKLHRERLELEMNVYKEWQSLLGEEASTKFLPKILDINLSEMACIMEFLGSYRLLDEQLFAGHISENGASSIGEFMASVHSKSHSTRLPSAEVDRLTESFKNSKLREIQLEYVFSKAFRESDRAVALREDAAFMAELEEIKAKYRGENLQDLALLHGDLHPGSAMIDNDSVKIIDPEFAIYGPPGLDLGSMMSGYVLAYIFHIAAGNDVTSSVLSAIEKMWETYKASMQAAGISSDTISGISRDAVGFTGCEVARTALGFAGVRGLPIKDEGVKTKAEEAALGLAQRCIMGRKGAGMELMIEEIKKFSLA